MTSYCDGIGGNLNADDGVAATGETFAHNDGSWPCLKGINLTVDDASEDSKLHYIVPSSYFDDNSSTQTHHMSLQTIALEDRTQEESIQGFPTYSLFNGTVPTNSWVTQDPTLEVLAEQSVSYTSTVPFLQTNATLGVGSTCYQVDSCGDTTFDPPSMTTWTQFAFTATVPGDLYGRDLTVTTSIVTSEDKSLNCRLSVPLDCSAANIVPGNDDRASMGYQTKGCLTDTVAKNMITFQGNGTAFGKSQCLCLGGGDALTIRDCSNGGTQQVCTKSNNETSGGANEEMGEFSEVPRNFVSANFRDGYQRLQAENVDSSGYLPMYLQKGEPTVCWGQGTGDTIWAGATFEYNYGDSGQVYTGYIQPLNQTLLSRRGVVFNTSAPYNVPSQIQFAGDSTCAPPPEDMADANAMIMMDAVDDTSVRRFYTNVEWSGTSGPRPLFAQSNGDYVQSFNVVARMPTCLSADDVTPANSTSGFTSSDYKTIGCYDTDVSYNPWTWTKTQDLGEGTGSYIGGSAQAVSPTNTNTWPSLAYPINDNHPDIVIRLAFYNTKLVTQSTGNPVSLLIADMTFQDSLVSLWGQNKPGTPLSLTSPLTDSLLTSDMRTLGFLEYTAAILYRGLYASNISALSDSDRWYSVSGHLLPTGSNGPYGAAEYLRDYFTQYLAAYTLIAPTVVSTVEHELTTTSQSVVTNAESYFRYPRIRYDRTTNTYYFDLYCDLFMHLDLLNDQGGTIQQFARNFFQDATLAHIQSGATMVMSPDSGSAPPEILLKGDPSHVPANNLVWTGETLTFVTSYYWTQPIEAFSAISMIYLGLLGTQDPLPDWLEWYATIGWTTPGLATVAPVGVPRLLAPTIYDEQQANGSSEAETCLTQTPLTTDCQAYLCAGLDCLCDYSILLNSIVLNPISSLYFNNSVGACACLASQSYPIGADNNERALNPVGLCFSQSCKEYGFSPPSINCASAGCASFTSAINRTNYKLSDGTWVDLFADQARGLDVEAVEETCELQVVVAEATNEQLFFWNWYAVATAIILTSLLPIFVGVDYGIHRINRGILLYSLFAGGTLLLAGIGCALVFGLAGIRTCKDPKTGNPVYDYNQTTQGRCVDRLTNRVELSPDVCNPVAATFCQCGDAESVCDGYFEGKGQCGANHMCCVCANSCFTSEITSDTTSLSTKTISTNLLLVGISVFLLIVIVVITVVPAWIGRDTQIWTGKKYITQPGRGPMIQWFAALSIMAVCGGGIGAGIVYGSKLIPVNKYTINKTLQQLDLSGTTVCS